MSTLRLIIASILAVLLHVSVASAQTIPARAAIALNPATHEVLFDQNAHVVRPIASLTKLMTAALAVELNLNPRTLVTVQPADVRSASITHLRARDKVSVDTLMHLMLIASDNGAARVLARTSMSNTTAFVRRMNERAKGLGLARTRYVDSSGLSAGNVSTAHETAIMLSYVGGYPYVSEIMQRAIFSTRIGTRKVTIKNTNKLLSDDTPVHAGKTGYIRKSGFGMAVWMQPLDFRSDVIVVVLGATSNVNRFTAARLVLDRATRVVGQLGIRVAMGVPLDWFTAAAESETCGPYPDRISDEGKKFIQRHEGLRRRAYRDVGGYAIGFGMQTWKGRRVTPRYPGYPSVSAIHAEFNRQIVRYEDIVRESVCAPLSQSAFDSLVSIAWNLGRVNTRILDKLHAEDELTPADFLSTATVRGRLNRVLKERRLQEFAMFVGAPLNNEDME